jgi:hypothetical protein
MVENIQNYKQSDLKFSQSKLYFQHQNQILQKIWFISPLTTDIHFKYTFQEIHENYFIEWWEFEWLTVDHDVSEQWIIYKIWFLNPKYQNIEHISLDLNKNLLDKPSFLPLIWWFFWWGFVFALLLRLYDKWQFRQILFWINIIGGWILFIFYGRKIFRLFYKKMKTKRVDYGWLSVNYTNHSDALMLSSEVIKILKNLWKEFWITKFCYTWNCIYLLQDLHDHEWNRLTSSSKLYSEQEKANLQQRTFVYLRQSEFLSLFSLT